MFKILVSCSDIGKKKRPQVSKKKVSPPQKKKKKQIRVVLASNHYAINWLKHLTIKFYIELDAINKISFVLDDSLSCIHIFQKYLQAFLIKITLGIKTTNKTCRLLSLCWGKVLILQKGWQFFFFLFSYVFFCCVCVCVCVTLIRSWSQWKANITTLETVPYSVQKYGLSVRKA